MLHRINQLVRFRLVGIVHLRTMPSNLVCAHQCQLKVFVYGSALSARNSDSQPLDVHEHAERLRHMPDTRWC